MTRTTLSWLVTLVVVGCGPAGLEDTSAPDAGGGGGPGGGGGSGGNGADASVAGADDKDGDSVDDAADNCPAQANKNQEDGDSDAYGDACDCDPMDPEVMGDLVLKDTLASNTNKFKVAPAFAAANWSYANGGLRQTRLANNASDATFLENDLPLDNVRIDVTASSTEIMDFDATDLRQIFVLARADSAAGKFGAVACGIEVVEGLTPTQKTTAAMLAGTPANVTIAPAQRTNRAAVDVNEEFSLHMDLKGTTMTCSATIAGVTTTATASNLGTIPGKVGFLTRETKGLFKNVRICAYR